MTSPITYLKHVRDEFAHIVWPSNRTAIAHALVVIGIAVAITVFVAALDFLLRMGVSWVTGV